MEAGWASIAGSSRYASGGTRLPRPSGTEREIVADALDMAGRAGHEDTGQRLLRHRPDLAFEAFSGGTALQ